MTTTSNYSHLLNDSTPCFELSELDCAGHHDICDLADEHGHASLTSALNDMDAWDKTVAEVAEIFMSTK